MSETFLLKNRYHEDFFELLCSDFQEERSDFPKGAFLSKTIGAADWSELELKDRMRRIRQALHEVVALPFREMVALFKKVIVKQEGLELEYLFFNDYVSEYGLEEWEVSMDALAFFTPYSTAEFAIRPFIIQDEKRTMIRMNEWSKDENHHIRRLATEGCRSRLPWGMALKSFKKDPSAVLPILARLRNDESEYVRRSVANNLNDIVKDNPEIVLEIGERWKGESKETDWVVKHAFRTLLKQGNTRALMLFAYGDPKEIRIENMTVESAEIHIGDDQYFNFELVVKEGEAVNARLEYAVAYVKKSGSISRKVFKVSEGKYESGRHAYRRKQRFQDFTTRKHYPGQHHIYLIVNGIEKASVSFELKPAK